MKGDLNYTVFSFCLIILIITSCNKLGNRASDKPYDSAAIKIPLIEKQIGESDYFISIPIDYSITISNGPDFSVYYFSPTDTTITNKLTGGLYFGNYPNEFDADNDSCKTETLMGKILYDMQGWTVYDCQGHLSIQTIADNKNGEGWNQKIHAFGHSKSKEELQTILTIHSTLRKK